MRAGIRKRKSRDGGGWGRTVELLIQELNDKKLRFGK